MGVNIRGGGVDGEGAGRYTMIFIEKEEDRE